MEAEAAAIHAAELEALRAAEAEAAATAKIAVPHATA
jgi:hypothetical protein